MDHMWYRNRELPFGLVLTGTRERSNYSTEYRFWVYTNDEAYRKVASFEVSIKKPGFKFGAGVAIGGEDGRLGLHAYFARSSVFVSILQGMFERTGFDEAWELSADIEWYERQELQSFFRFAKGYKIIHWSDLALGKPVYKERVLSDQVVEIPMPERSYRWRIKMHDDTWKRPRWLFAKHVLRCHADALPGEQIPIPGKGENPWDLDEDANFGLSCPASSVNEAVEKIVTSALRDRMRRAGPNWKPEAVKAEVPT